MITDRTILKLKVLMAFFIFIDGYAWLSVLQPANLNPFYKVSFLTAAINSIPLDREIIQLPNSTQYMFSLSVIKPTYVKEVSGHL